MDFIIRIDENILLWIQEYVRKDFLNPLVKLITCLGDAGWFWILITVILLFSKKYRKIGLTSAAALLIGFLITNLLLKNMVMRIRPYEIVEGLSFIGKKPSDFSFPSGHSTCSMASSVVLFLYLPKKYGSAALVLGIFICLSRLYVGVHYPTDVLAGMAVGILAAFIAAKIIMKQKSNA